MRKSLLSILSIVAVTWGGNHQALAQQYTALDCGTEFTMALRSDSTLWAWGYNANGQLGIDGSSPVQGTLSQAAPGQHFIGVATGGFHTLAIAADSTLWGWGLNGSGQLGVALADSTGPMPVATGAWRAVSGGFVHSAAIRSDGTLWTTGFNYGGQLGLGDTLDRAAWTQVGTDNDWKSVSCGGYHTLALKNDGSLWAWGYNATGALGTGSMAYSEKTPQAVLPGTVFSMTSAGFEFSTALRSDGTIWAWGFNGNGQTGQGSGGAVSQFTPAQVGSSAGWASITAGSSFAFAIRTDGTLWGWGFNGRGQLGMSGTMVDEPAQVGTDADWTMIAAADGAVVSGSVYGLFAAGLRQGAQSICTAGDNQAGQLGLEAGSGVTMQDFFGCDIGALPTAAGIVIASAPEVNIFPNPAREAITIQSTGMEPITATIISMDGRIVWRGALTQATIRIDTHTWPQGVYRVQGRDSQGTAVFNRQIVVR